MIMAYYHMNQLQFVTFFQFFWCLVKVSHLLDTRILRGCYAFLSQFNFLFPHSLLLYSLNLLSPYHFNSLLLYPTIILSLYHFLTLNQYCIITLIHYHIKFSNSLLSYINQLIHYFPILSFLYHFNQLNNYNIHIFTNIHTHSFPF